MHDWKKLLHRLDFAFQPIIDIHSGSLYGCEALLRGTDKVGFASIDAFFESAYTEGTLCHIEPDLRKMAMRKFREAGLQTQALLFYNLDNRLLECPNADPSSFLSDAEDMGLGHHFCLEISEKHPMDYEGGEFQSLQKLRKQGLRLAIDDYGTGFSGLQLLYYTDPDYIKIDRFFIQDIATDLKKKLFVSSLVNNAHMMGSVVLAEGVETQREYLACLEIGCDLVQGYYVQRPTLDIKELEPRYPHVCSLERRRRTERISDRSLIQSGLEFTEPVPIGSNAFDVFTRFQTGTAQFMPVVNHTGEPVGIIREASFKRFAYSRFGRELLQNKAARGKLEDFMDKIPVVDIHSTTEHILEVFSLHKGVEAILISENMRYAGHLSARSLLGVLHEKNIAIARDQNPLTRLPGNNVIFEYVSSALENTNEDHVLVYSDFDKFKPYNDRYGFRQGDRVILRFAEILREYGNAQLTAHIGGDDFFLGYRNRDPALVFGAIHECMKRFHDDVRGFYESEDIGNGYITSTDRDGVLCNFPIMTVSAVAIHLALGAPRPGLELLSRIMAEGKKKAKEHPGLLHVENVVGSQTQCALTLEDQ